jgi:hypothetical protein
MKNFWKNLDQDKRRYLGIGLIVLGIFVALNLWGLLPVLILGGLGSYVYTERRKQGRIPAAVQSGLWLVGLATLVALQFVFPGVLILAGASLLIRGREYDVDSRVVDFLGKMGVNVPVAPNAPIQAAHVPYAPPAPSQPYQAQETPEQGQGQAANTGETTRL